MDTLTIDNELEHYVGDRLTTNSREAGRRLYLRAVAHCAGPALVEYLDNIRVHATVYAFISHKLKLPSCHIESPLFLSSLNLLVAGIVMMAFGQFSVLIAASTSAGIVGLIHCGRRLLELWLENCVREAVFLELVEALREESAA
jgi:hypothetical protein